MDFARIDDVSERSDQIVFMNRKSMFYAPHTHLTPTPLWIWIVSTRSPHFFSTSGSPRQTHIIYVYDRFEDCCRLWRKYVKHSTHLLSMKYYHRIVLKTNHEPNTTCSCIQVRLFWKCLYIRFIAIFLLLLGRREVILSYWYMCWHVSS